MKDGMLKLIKMIALQEWKLREIRKELKGVLLGRSHMKIEKIYNTKLKDWEEMENKESE